MPTGSAAQINRNLRTVETVDTLLQRRTHVQNFARVEDRTGTARAVYHPNKLQLRGKTDDEVARVVLKTDPRIGWSGAKDDLRLIDDRTSPGGRHLTYQQFVKGVPVLDRYTRVSLDKSGEPTFIANGIAPGIEQTPDFDPVPRVSSASARQVAKGVFKEGTTRLGETELVVVPAETPELVWRTLAWPEDGGEYDIHVSARTGELSGVRDLTLHKAVHRSARTRPALSNEVIESRPAVVGGTMLDGRGLVFDPDPLATSGKSYAPPYVDNDDADTPELNAERKLVTLPEITLGADQLHRLIGPWVEVVGRRSSGQINYNPPEELNPDGFAYTRSDDRFEAVMVYYHIDHSQRHVQSLGFDDVENHPLPVNPFGEGDADVSNYYLNLDYLALGGGGVDDAEDAFVILHEYAHSLLNSQVPGLANTFEGRAIHEGWSDYWAASYQRQKFEKGELPKGNWKRFFRWDGNNPAISWFGRTMPDFKMYPTDLTKTSVYSDGLVWTSALMGVYDRLDRDLTDQLNIQSHYYLTSSATMEDAAYALIQADIDLYGGEHAADLVSVLGGRGFVDASSFKIVVTHDRLQDTEQLGGTVEVAAKVTAILSPIASVTVYYSGTGISGSSPMTTDDGSTYRAMIPLPATPSIVSYYIEAIDEDDQVSRIPAGAPDAPFVFVAGPDSEPPVITHTPLAQTSIYGWPATLQAQVVDNIAVDTVYVDFQITDNETSVVLVDSSFGLIQDGTYFSGSFPDVDVELHGRETVSYRIHAVDASASSNIALLPLAPDAPFTFPLSISGTVALYDFEQSDEDVSATGAWERGTPTYGATFVHSGSAAWVTSLDDSYKGVQTTSSLTLPPVDFKDLDSAWLEFWHWYDTEHDGTSDPGSDVEATLWDGGNVMVSVDNGATWNIVTPEGGYDGVIATGGGNPKQGEPAFGGYSYGWRRELVQIPGGSSVMVRFEFGTDISNNEPSIAYAGWMIDDVQFLVDRPTDETSPTVLEVPPAIREIAAGTESPPATITVGLTDDTGIENVTASYSISSPQGSGSGLVRLAMSNGDPTRFSANVPIPSGFAIAGTTIDYQITARDFDGNKVVTPAGSQRYRIAYILVEETSITAEATPSGGWMPQNGGWRIDGSTHKGSRAALVFPPIDLPVDATSIEFELTHDYRLQSGAGGQLSVAVGSADNWDPIDPDNGYPNETSAFIGVASESTSMYSLDALAGRHVWLRLDMLAQQPLGSADYWNVSSARVVYKGSTSTLEIPRSLELHPNYPNPFSTATTITYSVPIATNVRIQIFDILGRLVETLRDQELDEGTYTVRWQPNVAPGVYFIRLEADGQEKFETVTLAR